MEVVIAVRLFRVDALLWLLREQRLYAQLQQKLQQKDQALAGPPELERIRLAALKWWWSQRNQSKQCQVAVVVVVLLLEQPTEILTLSYMWDTVLSRWTVRMERIRHLSVFLSVLGGALSAIGRDSRKHARMALRLAQVQQQLAIAMGDEEQAARCLLYQAESYAFLGRFAVAETIVSHVRHRFTRNVLILNICDSVDSKLSRLLLTPRGTTR